MLENQREPFKLRAVGFDEIIQLQEKSNGILKIRVQRIKFWEVRRVVELLKCKEKLMDVISCENKGNRELANLKSKKHNAHCP